MARCRHALAPGRFSHRPGGRARRLGQTCFRPNQHRHGVCGFAGRRSRSRRWTPRASLPNPVGPLTRRRPQRGAMSPHRALGDRITEFTGLFYSFRASCALFPRSSASHTPRGTERGQKSFLFDSPASSRLCEKRAVCPFSFKTPRRWGEFRCGSVILRRIVLGHWMRLFLIHDRRGN